MLSVDPAGLFHMRKTLLSGVIILVMGLATGLLMARPFPGDEIDVEDHELTVVVGNSPFQFSPHAPQNGSTLIQATISYPSEPKGGLVAWELALYGPDNARIRTYNDRAYLPPEGAVSVAQSWDGRDRAGRLMPDGEYQYELTVRYAADVSPSLAWVSYDLFPLLFSNYETEGARGTTRILTGVDGWAAEQKIQDRNQIKPPAAALDPQFPLNFYYGNFHSQSNFSDGGWDVTGSGCNLQVSGRYCQGSFSPTDAYNYGRYTAQLDFLAVTDHNHLFDCSSATSGCRMDPATVLGKYQTGLAMAQSATEDGAFVAIYGEEFGVTSQPTDGHVGVLESPVLFNWEEHASGSCYDVFVGRSQYTALYTAMVNNPSPWGAIGILNHPTSYRQFNDYAINDDGKDAVVGLEVVNGPAFADSEALTCGGTHYDGDNVFCLPNCQPCDTTVQSLQCNLSQHHFMSALNKGFRVAPFASQDNHHNNFGTSTANRTVVLANALTKDEIMSAVRARHVFASSRDSNAQLVFITADGANVMGDSFVGTSPVNFHSSVRHPDGRDIVQELRVYIGYPGTTRAPSLARTSSRSTYDFSLTFNPGHYYVFLYVKQTDGSELWSAPMWIAVN